jgi:hypothetical protein
MFSIRQVTTGCLWSFSVSLQANTRVVQKVKTVLCIALVHVNGLCHFKVNGASGILVTSQMNDTLILSFCDCLWYLKVNKKMENPADCEV